MARTVITPQALTALAGQTITLASIDNTNGMQFRFTGREIILIQVPAASSVTMNVLSKPDPFNRDLTSGFFQVVLGASVDQVIGPFDTRLFGDGVGNVLLDFPAKTGTPVIAVLLIP